MLVATEANLHQFPSLSNTNDPAIRAKIWVRKNSSPGDVLPLEMLIAVVAAI